MKRITRNQFRTFLSVVQCGSMAAAAKQLNLTAPAVSIQIKQLEEFAGIPLLDRLRDGASPTEAGMIVMKSATKLEATIQDCEEELNQLKGLGSGHASVGGVSTAKYFTPHAFAAFSKLHPEIDMKLTIGNRAKTVSLLANYEIDIAVMGRPPRNIDVEYEAIGPHPHVIIAPPEHPLARRKNLSPTDLSHEIFLTREQGSGTRALGQEFLGKSGIVPILGMEIDSNETIKQAVIAGLGIAFISAHTIATEIKDGRLITLDVEGLPVTREWYVVRRQDKHLLPASKALWQFLKTRARDFLPHVA